MDDVTPGKCFGRWTVLSFHSRRHSEPYWNCRCECGTERPVSGYLLKNGGSVSCGCYRLECVRASTTTHGATRSPEYKSWMMMKSRCLNPNYTHYKYYGGRGITVCPSWIYSFETFLADLGKRPSPKHTLERIDDNGNYELGNCRWATRAEQSSNIRSNVKYTFDGETLTQAAWARRIGISPDTLRVRLERGWNLKEALTTPKLPTRRLKCRAA